MDKLQEQFLEDFEYFEKDLNEDLIAEINSEIRTRFDRLVDWYDSKEKFLSKEELAECYEVIRQKVYLKLNEDIKPFILLKK